MYFRKYRLIIPFLFPALAGVSAILLGLIRRSEVA